MATTPKRPFLHDGGSEERCYLAGLCQDLARADGEGSLRMAWLLSGVSSQEGRSRRSRSPSKRLGAVRPPIIVGGRILGAEPSNACDATLGG